MNIADNLVEVKKNLGDARLIAVTKTVDVAVIRELIDLGCTDLGENRIDVAEVKVAELGHQGIRWHMIGHLQSNKAKRAVRIFDMIHSIDSLKLLRILDREAGNINKQIDVLIQVNIGEEPQKSGVLPGDIKKFLAEASALGLMNVKVVGLMAMAPFVLSDETRSYFKRMKEMFDDLCLGYGLKELSMGMTNDYLIAIEEGSTMVRVGTALYQ